jgi:hypothetical protein
MLGFPKIKLIFPSKEVVKKPSSHKRIDHLHSAVSLSFSRVRDDTSRIFQWLDYLHTQNLEQQKTINSLRRDLSFVPKSSEDVKRVIDSYYSFDAMLKRLEKMEEKLVSLEQKRLESAKISDVEIEKKESLHSQLQRKMIKKITRNSKNYIKNTIVSLVSKYDKISALELREIIVEEQNLCSKSSFYRILEELEQEQILNVIAEGKEKTYFSNPQRLSPRPESKE